MGGGGKHSSALLTGYNQSATLNHILEQLFSQCAIAWSKWTSPLILDKHGENGREKLEGLV